MTSDAYAPNEAACRVVALDGLVESHQRDRVFIIAPCHRVTGVPGRRAQDEALVRFDKALEERFILLRADCLTARLHKSRLLLFSAISLPSACVESVFNMLRFREFTARQTAGAWRHTLRALRCPAVQGASRSRRSKCPSPRTTRLPSMRRARCQRYPCRRTGRRSRSARRHNGRARRRAARG